MKTSVIPISMLALAVAVLFALPVVASSGTWQQGYSGPLMLQELAQGWTQGPFICTGRPGPINAASSTILTICHKGDCGPGEASCPTGCPMGSEGRSFVNLSVAPEGGSLPRDHDFILEVDRSPTGPIVLRIGTVPTANPAGLEALATDLLVGAGRQGHPSCRALVCVGGANPGTACFDGTECLGGGTCQGVCSAGTAAGGPCDDQADCPGGACAPPPGVDSECTVTSSNQLIAPVLRSLGYGALVAGMLWIAARALRRRLRQGDRAAPA